MFKLNQTYLNGNLVFLLRKQKGGVEAVAAYGRLVANFSHKRIYFGGRKTKVMQMVANRCGMSLGTLNKCLEVLIRYKVVKITEEGLFIQSNDFINQKYPNPINKKGEVLIPRPIYMDNKHTYSELKFIIRNLSVYSSAKEQVRVSKKKAHIDSIISRIDTASLKEVKKVKEYYKKRGKPFSDNSSELKQTLGYQDEITLSNKKYAEKIGRKSQSTAVRHKKKLASLDPNIQFIRRYSPRTYCSLTEHYEAISNGVIPPYSKYKNGYSYFDLSTEIVIFSPTYANSSYYYYTNTTVLNPISN